MPTAKIVTRLADSAASLADYLARLGYRVETVTPEQSPTSTADIEITLEMLPREQALQHASQLAAKADADILVAPGVIENVQQSQAHAVEPAAIEVAEERNAPEKGESRLAVGSRVVRETLGEWRRRSRQGTVSAAGRFAEGVRLLRNTGITAATQCGAKSKDWIAEAWIQMRRNAARVAVLGKGKVEQLREQAAERARVRAAVKARRQELEQQHRLERQQQEEHRARQAAAAQAARSTEELQRKAALRAAQLREKREQEAALHKAGLRQQQEQQVRSQELLPQEEQDQQDDSEDLAAPTLTATRLLRPPQARSSLVAYTRSRDWKMAFIGAAAASAVIMVVSFSFLERTPGSHAAQQPAPIPAPTVQTSAPALMVPAPEIAPPPLPGKSAKTEVKTPAVSPSLQPANVSQVELNAEDDSFEEVVVRHYPSHQAAKARTGTDGVKRISDLE